jgi:hypothetical protein
MLTYMETFSAYQQLRCTDCSASEVSFIPWIQPLSRVFTRMLSFTGVRGLIHGVNDPSTTTYKSVITTMRPPNKKAPMPAKRMQLQYGWS